MEQTLHLLIMYTMLVLMVLLLHKGRKVRSSLFLAAYAVVEIITNGVDGIALMGNIDIMDEYPLIPFLAKPFTLLWVPLFYFYVRSNFSRKFNWRNILLLHLIPFGAALSTFLVLILAKGKADIKSEMFHFGSFTSYALYVADIVLRVQYFLYNVYMIYKLLRYEKQLKNNELDASATVSLPWLRFIVYGYALACFGAILTFVIFHYNWSLGGKVNILSILYFFLFFFILFYHTITTKTTPDKKKTGKIVNDKEEYERLIDQLDHLLKTEQVYINHELNLKDLASQLNTRERLLSQAINTIRQRNFKDYINSYRIAHACRLLKENTNKPIFEVMFESGFNTKGPFNSAFKKETGFTPSAYRLNASKNEE